MVQKLHHLKKLDKLISFALDNQKNQNEIHKKQNEISDEIRRILNAIGTETKECPRFFSLSPAEARRWDPRLWTKKQYKLELWCEQPEAQHPCEEGQYTITQSRDWVAKLALYASLVAKTLKLAVPLAAPALEMALGEDILKGIKPQLEFMEKLTSGMLEGELDTHKLLGDDGAGITQAEGAGLRELRWLLLEVDPAKNWGGLRPVLNSSGDYLWVCPKHHSEYDPGLPVLAPPT